MLSQHKGHWFEPSLRNGRFTVVPLCSAQALIHFCDDIFDLHLCLICHLMCQIFMMINLCKKSSRPNSRSITIDSFHTDGILIVNYSLWGRRLRDNPKLISVTFHFLHYAKQFSCYNLRFRPLKFHQKTLKMVKITVKNHEFLRRLQKVADKTLLGHIFFILEATCAIVFSAYYLLLIILQPHFATE